MSIDLASTFNEILVKHDTAPLQGHFLTLEHIGNFLKDAYRINSQITNLTNELISIRTPYLSTITPSRRSVSTAQAYTDTDRDTIDADAKSKLRELKSAIDILTNAEQTRQTTQRLIQGKKYGSKWGGIIASWAAGGLATSRSPEEVEDEARSNTMRLHRENVLWYLNKRYADAFTLQASMMEIRMRRVVERNKGVLAKSRMQPQPDFMVQQEMALKTPLKEVHVEENLSQEQLQLFEAENQDLLKHYENTLQQVQIAEKSMLEISELQTQLVSNLQTQSVHIEQLVQDSLSTTDNVGSGNKELKKATERKSTAKYVFYASCGLSFSLILWDWLI